MSKVCIQVKAEDISKLLYEVYDVPSGICENIKNMQQRLEEIDNANPSEALKWAELLECDLQATNDLVTRTINGYDYLDILETIKQALLKAQEQEKVLNDALKLNGEWAEELDNYKDLEEQLGCPLETVIEFIKLLKKYYYVGITGRLEARTIWNNTDLNEKELYKINHIFNNIKDRSE